MIEPFFPLHEVKVVEESVEQADGAELVEQVDDKELVEQVVDEELVEQIC